MGSAEKRAGHERGEPEAMRFRAWGGLRPGAEYGSGLDVSSCVHSLASLLRRLPSAILGRTRRGSSTWLLSGWWSVGIQRSFATLAWSFSRISCGPVWPSTLAPIDLAPCFLLLGTDAVAGLSQGTTSC